MPAVLLPCFAALVAVSQALVFDPEDIIVQPEDIQKLLVDWQLVSQADIYVNFKNVRAHFCNLCGIQTQDHVFAETFAIKKYNGDVLSVITKGDIVRTASYVLYLFKNACITKSVTF